MAQSHRDYYRQVNHIGSNTDFDTKRQRRDYYRQVNHVAIKGPITQTKWSHMPITFTSQDVKLASFPHIDAMVITVHIDRWDINKILINNDSQAEILFLAAFNKIGFDRKQLKESTKPLYDFGGKQIEPVGVIILSMSFGTPKNPRTKFITFDVVDMIYPYNAIFRRGLLNTFKIASRSAYLCLKIPATFRVISIFWQSARCQKHREGFHAKPQKYTFPARRPRAAHYLHRSAQSRSSGKMQESHRT
jgi:hypothetical protein